MSETDPSPNVLLILDDQHRFDWLGCAGNPAVRTPNIDRLAARGMRFSRCYTNAPVCAPARIALAAGQLPHRVGALGNQAFLPLSARTYYQQLHDHGSHVGAFGKFDLAKPDPYNGARGDRPVNFAWGFTHPLECEGKMHAGSRRHGETPLGPYQKHLQQKDLLETFRADYAQRARTGWWRDTRDSVLPAEDFEDAYIGRKAAEWIENHPGDFPWHCFVSFVGPHDPFDPPTEYAARYRGASMPEPTPPAEDAADKPEWIRQKSASMRDQGRTPEQIAEARRQFSAAVEQIDDEVGRLLNAVAQRGELENTYVIFSSDHGEMLGDHGLYQKSVPYEASARVPLVVAGPGIPAGETRETPVELIDLNPTICELMGAPPAPNLDARSLAPVLFGEAETHREAAVGMLEGFQFAVDETHKLVLNVHDRTELYHLQNDPEERRNIAEDDPEAVRRLRSALQQRRTEGAWNR
jgi:choline-sulfatase